MLYVDDDSTLCSVVGTGVIVSAGNETIWEAVCRGVPVLTIPTDGHGEQLLNAAVHARNFPTLVRARHRLHESDISWLVNFQPYKREAVGESTALREKVSGLLNQGSPLLGGLAPDAGNGFSMGGAASAGVQAVMKASRAGAALVMHSANRTVMQMHELR